jgi:hypothetical protein
MHMDSCLFISGFFKRNPLRIMVPNEFLMMDNPSVGAVLCVQDSQTSQRNPKSKSGSAKEYDSMLPGLNFLSETAMNPSELYRN